jgi:hypothetical protein
VDFVTPAVDDVAEEFLGDEHDAVAPKLDGPVPKETTQDPDDLPEVKVGGPAVVAGAGGVLGELVAAHESGKLGYNAFNRGNAGDSSGKAIDFSSMTIKEVMNLQRAKKLFAVGKYQIVPQTMILTVNNLVPRTIKSTDVRFTPLIQEIMFRQYLVASKRREAKDFITGAPNSSLELAQAKLALEWAALKPPSGLSRLSGLDSNHAVVAASDVANALNQERAAYSRNLRGGMTPDQAWAALSPGLKSLT